MAGPDPCMGGYLPDIAHACCGHGNPEIAYCCGFDDCRPNEQVATGKYAQCCARFENEIIVEVWPNLEAYVLDENGKIQFDEHGEKIFKKDYHQPGFWVMRGQRAIDHMNSIGANIP